MNKKLFIAFFSFFIFTGCHKPPVPDSPNQLFVHLEKELTLIPSDSIYSSVSYIPLETTDESIFYEINKILVHDDIYYLLDSEQSAILTFNEKGEYLCKLSKKGLGPGEYLSLDDFFIDDSLVYVLSSDIQKILVYDLSFNFIKDFFINTHAGNMDFLGDHIFVYADFRSSDFKNIYVIDKTTGEVINKQVDYLEKQRGVGYGSSFSAKWNDSLYVFFPYDYSICTLNQNQCEKFCSIDFGKQNMFPDGFSTLSYDERNDYIKSNCPDFEKRPVDGIDDLYISDRFLFFTFVYHLFEYKFFWDKKSGQYTVGSLASTEKYPFSSVASFLSIYQDKVITCVTTESILGYMERIKNAEIPYETFQQLNESDNPVLCIHTLK
jgi:hypothetical protein